MLSESLKNYKKMVLGITPQRLLTAKTSIMAIVVVVIIIIEVVVIVKYA